MSTGSTIDTSGFEAALAAAALELDDVEMAIGFNTVYAVVQHERLDFRHEAPGQAKYLETPLREYEDLLPRTIAADTRDLTSIEQLQPAVISSVRDVGLHILGLAQALTPVGGGKYSPYDPAPSTLAGSATWRGPGPGEKGTLGSVTRKAVAGAGGIEGGAGEEETG